MNRVAFCFLLTTSCAPRPTTSGWTQEVSNSIANLHAVRAFGRERVLAVGDGAATVAWVDGVWRERKLGGNDTLTGIWGSGEDDVFIVGGSPGRGVVWHTGIGFFRYDGITVPGGTPMLHGVHGTAHGDVWVVGDDNTALHYDGTTFTAAPVPTPAPLTAVQLRGVYCRATSDCWAVGLDGVTAHWDGTTWSTTISSAGTGLLAINGAGTEVLIAGERGTLLNVVDGRVGIVGSPDPSRSLQGVWMAGGNDAWAVGDSGDTVHALVFRLEGTADWKVVGNPDSPRTLRGIHGVDGHLLWAVGDEGYIYRLGVP
jgi:hypothetical protein